MSSYELASLAMQHFIYAGLLSCLFAVLSAVYLWAMWSLAGTLNNRIAWLIHSVFFLWQSNIAFVAVISLSVGVHNRQLAGESMRLWNAAPFIVPSSAILYTSVLLLCMAIVWLRGRSRAVSGVPGERTEA